MSECTCPIEPRYAINHGHLPGCPAVKERHDWIVADTPFNRHYYSDIIGKRYRYHKPPSYAGLREATFPNVEYLCTEQNVITEQAIVRLNAAIRGIRKIYP